MRLERDQLCVFRLWESNLLCRCKLCAQTSAGEVRRRRQGENPGNHQHLGVWLKRREGGREAGEKNAANCVCEAEEGLTSTVN